MAQYIQVGSEVVEFPDGMSRPQIEAALRGRSRQYDPTEGMSGLEKFRAGMGKAISDIGLGARQAMGFASQDEVDERKRLDAALMKTGAGTAGNLLTNIGMAAGTAFIPGANTLTGAALTGAAINGLQPLSADQSRLSEIGLGAATGLGGQAAANVIGRALKPVQAFQTPAEAELVKKAQAMGIPLNAAQLTGSKPLRWIDSALDNLPFTAEKQAALKGAQREVWQRKVLEQVGINADNASPDVLGSAYSQLGQQFRDLSARNTVDLGNDFLTAIASIDAKKTPFSKGVDEVVSNALELAGKGKISGADYQTVRSSLTQASKGAWSQNPELGQALKTLRNALDDSAGASMSAEDKAAWDLVRKQYAALKTVEKAVDPMNGAISPKKFINEVARTNPQGARYGFGDQELPELARVGKAFIADNLPDSGTAQRSWYMNLLQNPTAGIGGAAGFLTGGPAGAVLGAATGAVTPLAAQRALWGNSRYLTKGLLDPEVTQPVLRPILRGASIGLLPELAE